MIMGLAIAPADGLLRVNEPVVDALRKRYPSNVA
jgi:hypothetical protein